MNGRGAEKEKNLRRYIIDYVAAKLCQKEKGQRCTQHARIGLLVCSNSDMQSSKEEEPKIPGKSRGAW